MYKLLLVDDEPLIIQGIKSFVDFEKLNISEVYEAKNGVEALDLFQVCLPDLVLADINMPKMNGLEFSKKAKQIKPDVKIAMITGYDYFDYAVTALKMGVDDYVLKPVSRIDIEQVLAKLLEKVKEGHEHSKIKEVVQELISNSGASNYGYKQQIQAIIERQLGNNQFSLSFLADEMALSPGYLSGLFKSLFGRSFQDYLKQLRLDQAKIMLLSSDMKIYEIALKIGFEDPNYFSTAFKKAYNCSPNQYRERGGEM